MALKETVEFYLIRHAQSDANVKRELYRHKPDPQIWLSEKGQQQAEVLSDHIPEHFRQKGEKRPIIIACSGHARALATAQPLYLKLLKAGFKVHIRVSDKLAEQSLGLIAGNEKWRDEFPEYARQFDMAKERNSLHFLVPPGGESRAQVEMRVHAELKDLRQYRETHGKGPVIIVSHGETSRQLVKVLMRQHHSESDAEPGFGNTDVRLIARPATEAVNLGRLFNLLFTRKKTPLPMTDFGFIWKDGAAHAPTPKPRPHPSEIFKSGKFSSNPYPD